MWLLKSKDCTVGPLILASAVWGCDRVYLLTQSTGKLPTALYDNLTNWTLFAQWYVTSIWCLKMAIWNLRERGRGLFWTFCLGLGFFCFSFFLIFLVCLFWVFVVQKNSLGFQKAWALIKDLLPGNFNVNLWWRGRDWQEGTCPTAGRSPGLQGAGLGREDLCRWVMGSWQQPGLHSPAQSALIYCVYIQPATQSARQPQLMFWNGVFQGFGGFWGGVFLVFCFLFFWVCFKSLMLIIGITSFTSQNL